MITDFDLDRPVGRWGTRADYLEAYDRGDVPVLVAPLDEDVFKASIRQAFRQGRTYLVVPQAWEDQLNAHLDALLSMGMLGATGPCCMGVESDLCSAVVWEVCLLPTGHEGECGPDDPDTGWRSDWPAPFTAEDESFGWVKRVAPDRSISEEENHV